MLAAPDAAMAQDRIGIDLRPTVSSVQVGDVIGVRIFAVREPQGGSSFLGFGEAFRVLDLYFSWNPQDLKLLGLDNTGAAPGISGSGFMSPSSDFTGTNEAVPPADGTGYFFAQCLFQPVYVTTQGTLVSTMRFQVLRQFNASEVNPIVSVPSSLGIQYTQVIDAALPGYVSTGTLSGAQVTQGPQCPADLNGDGEVESYDLTQVLAAWGTVNSPANLIRSTTSPAVDGEDLAFLLAAWGPCGN
jgi:hypothetical protein